MIDYDDRNENELKNLVDNDSTIKKGTLVLLKENHIPLWAYTSNGSLADARIEYESEMGPLLYLGYRKVHDTFFGDYRIRHYFLLSQRIYYFDACAVPNMWWTLEDFVATTFMCLNPK